MAVYIANFGRENYEWPDCLERSTVATMNERVDQKLWERGDREGYIRTCMQGRTAAGVVPTRPVASRWFNLMTIVSRTAGDVWIHRQRDELWWTTSRDEPPVFVEKVEPIARGREVVVCHKPCDPWSDRDRKGRRLGWNILHPKAREFLFAEGTLQCLSDDNAEYALGLIAGDDLTPWHARPEWQRKTFSRPGKGGAGTIYNGLEKAAYRIAAQAFATAAVANGQQALRKLKNKDVAFSSQIDLERYIVELYRVQEGLCTLTGLRMEIDGECEDEEMLCSLDRIDSDGHYAPENLQIVCRFANRWKGARDDAEFKRLIRAVRAVRAIDAS